MQEESGKRAAVFFVLTLALIVAFGYFMLQYTRRVDGVSMRPTLESGDLVIVQPTEISSIRVGDIIIFQRPFGNGCLNDTYNTIIHRVVAINSGGLVTQGDNRLTNPVPDEDPAGPFVQQKCLVGKVVVVIPYLERIADLFPYPSNYLLAALIVIVLLITELRPGAGGEKEQAGTP